MDFEEARGLPTSEINFSNVTVRQSITRNNIGTIPKIINCSAGRGLIRVIDLPASDLPKSTNPHLGKEVTGNEIF